MVLSQWIPAPIASAQSPMEVRFRVVDKGGRPVPNAVVELIAGDVGEAAMDTAIMDQVHKAFLPKVLDITQGQKVTFPNSDQIRHHVYSFSPSKSFEIRLYAGTPGAPIEFDKPGVVVLGCNIHDKMVGYIYVGATPFHGISNDDGRVQVPQPATYSGIKIWHPGLSLDGQKVLNFQTDQLISVTAADGRQVFEVSLPIDQAGSATGSSPSTPDNNLRNKFRKFGTN